MSTEALPHSVIEVAAPQELTIVDRARNVLAFDATKERLTALAATSVRMVEITNTAGAQEIHAARMVLKSTRVAIEKTGKAAREDAIAYSKAVIKAESELIEIISPEEARLGVIEDAWEAARKAERDEKTRIEQEAQTIARAKLDDLRNLPISLMAATPERLAEAIAATEAFDVFEFIGTMQAEAKQVKASTALLLQKMIADKRDAEEAARVAAIAQAEADKQRELDDAAAAETARLAKTESDRVAAEQAAERKKLDDERIAAATERQRLTEEANAKQKAIDDAAAEERARLDAEAEAVRQADAEKLRKEREVFEEKKAESEKAARQKAIDTATLLQAATAAHTLLFAEGLGERLETQMLAAALVRAIQSEAA
jgi:hypothetical protein